MSSYDCNGTGAQKWIINNGNTKVQVASTNFCLDAGSSEFYRRLSFVSSSDLMLTIIFIDPASGVGMKIWTCFSDLPAQAWFYTDDKRIAVTGQGVFHP